MKVSSFARIVEKGALLLVVSILLASLLPGCASAPQHLPPRAPMAVKVLVPVSKPCEVVVVPKSPLPSEGVSVIPHDIYEAVKLALADRATLMADREALSAANDKPCG